MFQKINFRANTKKNLGKGRAEPRTVYPLLYDPNEVRVQSLAKPKNPKKKLGSSTKHIYSNIKGCKYKA